MQLRAPYRRLARFWLLYGEGDGRKGGWRRQSIDLETDG